MSNIIYTETESYKWSYYIQEKAGTMCKEVGVISKNDFEARTKAIASGEYKPKIGDPKCWYMPTSSDDRKTGYE